MEKKRTLAGLSIGETAVVKEVRGESSITKRLMEMGIIPGVSIEVIKTAPFGSPIQVRLRGYNLAIRRNEAEFVEIIP